MKKVFFSVLLLIAFTSFSQTENDTINSDIELKLNSLNQQLETYERLLEQTSQKRVQDSLARMELIEQIQLLQQSDDVNQRSINDQIRLIEQSDSLRSIQQKAQLLELKMNTKGFNVAPLGDSLYTIYTRLGSMLAEDRASNEAQKVELLVRDDFFFPDSMRIEEHDGTMDIMYRNLIVTSVSDWDALWVDNGDKRSMANSYRDRIAEFVTDARNRSTVQNIAARIGLVFLILGGVVLILYFIRRLANGIQGWMVVNKGTYFTGIKIRSFELLPPTLHLDVGIRSVSILKWAFYALVFYLSLPLIFGLFPFTRGWAQTLLDWILSPAKNVWFGFWNYLPNVFTIAVIFVVTRYLVKFLKFIAVEVENSRLSLPGFYSDWAVPTYRLVKLLIYAFMIVMIYPYLPGSDSDIFKGVSIFIGLIVAFGSTSAIANAIAGLVITYTRPFRVGDRVSIGEVTGEIVAKALLVTRVRTSKNEDITVPNSSILTGHTINYTSSSRELGLILHTSVTIGYDVPWRKVHELLIEAAVATDGVNVSREPFVLQTSLDDSYVSYQLNAYTDTPNMMPRIYSELHGNIQDKFNEAGIEIMSPHYRAVRDGNDTTIPKTSE